MGRNAKNIGLHLHNGNPSHLTKEEIEERQNNQIKLGDRKLKLPAVIKETPEAYKKWKEILKVFKETDLVTSADIRPITDYCLLVAEVKDLRKLKSKMMQPDPVDLFGGIIVADVKGMLELDSAINRKLDALLKLEDRLFLNPVSRTKNIPKKEQEKFISPLEARGFANL
jgi:phage terminase small subunit